jgi:DNA replication protein DnaC
MEATAMLNSETMDKLRRLKLSGMAEVFRNQMDDAYMRELSFEERFGLLVDAEYTKRKNALLQRLIAAASFKIPSACMEGIEYDADRRLDRDLLFRLSTCEYIEEHRNVVIMGPTGAGKTFVGCALGMAACRKFLKVKYIRLPEMLTGLSIAQGDLTIRKLMTAYKNYDLLILDEWLLTPLAPNAASNLLNIVDERCEHASTVFITQCAPGGWHSMIGEGRVADALLDRIVHNSYEILIEGDSMRSKKSFKKKTDNIAK